MPLHWLPPRRYRIPARHLTTARGQQTSIGGTLFSCTDGVFTGWGDAPDAASLRGNGQHRDAVEQFAEAMAQLHLEAQQEGVSLAAWLHAEFPQWTVPPRAEIELQGLVDFAQLRADPAQAELAAVGLRCLKVKLAGREPPDVLAQALHAARAQGWTLRVDVNGGWLHRLDLAELFEACRATGVEYVEDPLPIKDMTKPSVVSIAADAIDSSVDAVLAAARAGLCEVVVVKPPLWGGVAKLLSDVAALHAGGIRVVLSSSFEGPVGLAHLAQLAAVLPTPQPAGLATHLLWPSAWQPPELQVTAGRWRLPAAKPSPLALIHASAEGLVPVALGVLSRQAHALAAHLAGLGVKAGSVVATWAGNAPETVVAWHAVRLLAATWLPLHPRLTAAEVLPLLARALPAALLVDRDLDPDLFHDILPVIDLKMLGSLPEATTLPRSLDQAAIAALLFTSGSTGPAKGVQLSWRALNAGTDAALAQFGRQPGGSWLCCLPVCHVSGLMVLQRAERLGMTVLLSDQPSTRDLAELLHAMEPRLASLVPAQLTRLLDEQVAAPRELLAVIIGGAPCPADLVDRARAAGWPVLPSFGMTETAAQVATAPLETRLARTPWPRADDATCVGPAIPGVELRVVAGEIHVRGAQLLSGYLGEDSPVHEGWLHTGDLGRIDANGWLWVAGRRGEMILRGGENITPDEVEAALLAIPGVREACVVGVADRVLGQRVAAWLTVAEVLDGDAIPRHLAHLAAFKRPEVWLVTPASLPRTGPGKVARGEVRARLQELATHG